MSTQCGLDFGLHNVHVLITGAAGGIGLSTVRTFLQLGARVTAQYNTRIGDLANLSQVVAIQADVRSESDIDRLFLEASSRNHGPVSVLVVNHGIFPVQDTPLTDMTLSQWQNTISVNLTGPFLLCRRYLCRLRDASDHVRETASIVLIGSTAGKFGEAGHADYASSKAALMYGLTPTLKNEIVAIAPRARVNSVNPGWVATPMAEKIMSDEALMKRALATTPLRKVATTEDVARQVAVLASPILSGHVNGMNVMVDGGMEGRLLFPST